MTMTTREKNALYRDAVYRQLECMDLDGFEYKGEIKEGLLFHNAEEDMYISIKTVVKSPNFNATHALEAEELRKNK